MHLQVGLPTAYTVLVGTDSYLLRRRVETTLPSGRFLGLSAGAIYPAVVLNGPGNALPTLLDVKEGLARFLETDDVIREDFTHNGFLIVKISSGLPEVGQSVGEQKTFGVGQDQHVSYVDGAEDLVSKDLKAYLEERALTLVFAQHLSVPEGPYLTLGENLHEAWKLYSDHLAAFTTSIVPDDDLGGSAFTSLQSMAFTGGDAAIAVPSRLYFEVTPDKPLNGLRVALKDNIHVAGVVTGLGNKAYAELYGKQNKSADIVQTLMSQGAIIVGKTKLSAFAGSEVPPDKCIDYFPPWNPRGDGYQGPSGSSSGPGASAAGYGWLDLAIGTDTTGSIRHPASSHGVWAHKLTWGSVSTNGVVPASEPFDSIGLLGRTPSVLQKALSASGFKSGQSKPSKILVPTEWLPVSNVSQQRMIELFIQALETYVGVEHTIISLAEEWSRSGPETLRDKISFGEAKKLAVYINSYDNYHIFDDFRAEYKEKFQKPPYVSPSHLKRWNDAVARTQKERDEAVEDLKIFRKWFTETLLTTNNDGSPSAIMVVPQGRPGANYRDTVPLASPPSKPTEPSPPPQLSAVFATSMAGAPQLMIPIGQNPYESKVSARTEFAPIFTTIIGAPGTDLDLLRLGQEVLESAGWPTEVQTGRFMFDVGDNERHSARREESHKL